MIHDTGNPAVPTMGMWAPGKSCCGATIWKELGMQAKSEGCRLREGVAGLFGQSTPEGRN